MCASGKAGPLGRGGVRPANRDGLLERIGGGETGGRRADPSPRPSVRKEAAKDACRPHVLGLSPRFGLLSPGPAEEARTPVPHSCPPAGPPISVAKPCSGRGGLDLGTAEREGKGGLQRTRHHWRIWNYPSEEGAWSRRVIEVWPRGVCPPGFPGTAPSSRRSLPRSKRGAFAGGGDTAPRWPRLPLQL